VRGIGPACLQRRNIEGEAISFSRWKGRDGLGAEWHRHIEEAYENATGKRDSSGTGKDR
jgi:hypothetical protein